MNEIKQLMDGWHPIKNFPGYYVDAAGKIRGYKGIMHPHPIWSGYLHVTLHKNKTQRSKAVHRLVAETLIPNPLHKVQVNHKNGVKSDNRCSNLEWCTASENQKHRYNVLKKYNPREAMIKTWTTSKKKRSKPVECIETSEIFESLHELEQKTGIWASNVCRVCNGQLKTAGGKHWRYYEKA